MKAALTSVALCLALSSSLAHAQDLNPPLDPAVSAQLRLKNPLWADAVVGREVRPPAPDGAPMFQGFLGLVGGVAVAVPAAWAGYNIGNTRLPPSQSCDQAGCDVGYPFGGVLGILAGSMIGVTVGTGFGVAGAGALQGGAFHLGHAMLGAGAGAVLAFAASLALMFAAAPLFFAMPLLVPAAVALGAMVGSVWWYQSSHPFGEPVEAPAASPAPPAPMVRLVPGGAVTQIAGTF